MPFWSAWSPCASRFFCFWRARTTISAPPAPAPTTPAATSRAQRRGSRSALGSHSASSSTAASVSSVSRRSSRSLSRSGGSIGTRAPRSSRSTSLIAPDLPQPFLELLDRSVQQHLGGPFGPSKRACDLLVVHPEGEAHDQRLATVVRQLHHPRQHVLQLLAPLDDVGRVVRGRDHGGVLELRLRLARAVAVVVRREIVRDPDQPRPERPAVRLALRPVEVTVGLEERLLRQVLGVVVVARAVVAVAVDVAQVGAVQLAEVAVEPGLVCERLLHALSLPGRRRRPQAARRPPARTFSIQRSGAIRPSTSAASASVAGASTPVRAQAAARSGADSRPWAVPPGVAATAPAGTPLASISPARLLRLCGASAVASRSPTPARPSNVSGWAPSVAPRRSSSLNTRPPAAPAAFMPLVAAAEVARAAAFLAAPASSTPITSSVRSTSMPARSSASPSWRRKSRSVLASTAEAPLSTASAEWNGPPRQASARAFTRSRT